VERGRWVAGNRHRVIAALVGGWAVLGRTKRVQVVSWRHDSHGTKVPDTLHRLSDDVHPRSATTPRGGGG
jgi:hypothetical protein